MTDRDLLLEEKYDGDASAAGFAADCARLEAGEPLAYVIGWQPFLGLRIFLDSHPLIPRPETEWWTEQLLTLVSPESAPISFLDLCAGSGAIGCAALARLPHAHVSFGELDGAHEATIWKNIRDNGLNAAPRFAAAASSRADVRIGDLFAPFSAPATCSLFLAIAKNKEQSGTYVEVHPGAAEAQKFDVIAANPPYIPTRRALDASVADFEPHQALFAGNDGLALIRRIAAELPHHLKRSGTAWIECDSSHAKAARKLFEDAGFRATLMHDQYDRPRVVVVHYP